MSDTEIQRQRFDVKLEAKKQGNLTSPSLHCFVYTSSHSEWLLNTVRHHIYTGLICVLVFQMRRLLACTAFCMWSSSLPKASRSQPVSRPETAFLTLFFFFFLPPHFAHSIHSHIAAVHTRVCQKNTEQKKERRKGERTSKTMHTKRGRFWNCTAGEHNASCLCPPRTNVPLCNNVCRCSSVCVYGRTSAMLAASDVSVSGQLVPRYALCPVAQAPVQISNIWKRQRWRNVISSVTMTAFRMWKPAR